MPWKEVSVMSQRLEFVRMASGEQANIRQLCRHFNISAPTAYCLLPTAHCSLLRLFNSFKNGGVRALLQGEP